MPKIVDHAAHSQDLAGRAAAYFSQHGYGGSSMRKIAMYLGVSKSALYHYFPTKEALFLACTKQVMARADSAFAVGEGTQDAQIEQLTDAMRDGFGPEMALVFDYLRGKSKNDIATDEAMRIALDTYRNSVESIVGPAKTDETLAMILGTLLLEYMSGT